MILGSQLSFWMPKVPTLTRMGYDEKSALQALEAADGDIHDALEILLDEGL